MTMPLTQKNRWDGWLVLVALVLCVGHAVITHDLRRSWPGVHPAPTSAQALSYGFGDAQFSYRNIALFLQNAGDIGGHVTNLKDYNYERLRDWFNLTYELDYRANWVPSLAAYYFGATKKKQDTCYLVDYLAKAGSDKIEGVERWRWLAHAVYMARFVMKDQDKALELANQLAAIATPDMPIWTKQMPAYVMSKVGQKKAARDLILTVMATDKSLVQADINQSCWYIDHNLREAGDGLEENPVYQTFCMKK